MGQSLYRFFGAQELNIEGIDRDIQSLANTYLWFSDLGQFNDPFEGMGMHVFKTKPIEEVPDGLAINIIKGFNNKAGNDPIETENIIEKAFLTNRFGQLKKETLPKLKEVSDEGFERAYLRKACCFVRDSDKYGEALNNKLMWGHYGNGLRGFVVEFDQDKLFESIEKQHEEVHYAEVNYKSPEIIDFYEHVLGTLRGENKGAGYLISSKDPAWEYEAELRITMPENLNYYSVSAIKSISFGNKMSVFKQMQLFNAIKSFGCFKGKIQKISVDLHNLDLRVDEIDILNLDAPERECE